ncbi:hypothetical protein DFH07DRAFT_948524 [Mycena maculata]|uniref:Uncharacterized protein n=1 Tax=Mycena maculata TaxID=230809 RepID=A0AAD7KDK7_9AGAR|nr:hypothetical protein DFH07DRAFT_948524 [Mycena maculata]
MAGDAAAEALAENTRVMADMAKTLSDMKAQLEARPATTPLEQIIGRAANPLAFPPGAHGTYPAISTSFLHPHLLPDAILQIREFKFPPASLGRLLETHSVVPPAPLLLVVGPNGEAQFMPQPSVTGVMALLREVPDIVTFVQAWMIFVSVFQNEHCALPVAQALAAHLNTIILVARVYPWPTVLDYHVAFMQARAQDFCFNPSNWMKSDPHLHTLHLLTPFIVPSAAATPSLNNRAGLSQVDIGKMASQVCYFYNDDGCGGPDAGCFRRYICRHCKAAGHTWKVCPNRGAPPLAAAPVA